MLTDKTLQSVAEAVKKVMKEELKGNQKTLDKNNNNRLDSQDFKILRGEKKAVKKEEVEQVEEGWDDMMKAVKEKKGPQPSGGSGKKEGTRYGGSKQKDEKEKMKEEVEIDERTLTEPEMKKREEVVKSMKKGMQGFKQRYGDRAKEVMYATATKIAKKD